MTVQAHCSLGDPSEFLAHHLLIVVIHQEIEPEPAQRAHHLTHRDHGDEQRLTARHHLVFKAPLSNIHQELLHFVAQRTV